MAQTLLSPLLSTPYSYVLLLYHAVGRSIALIIICIAFPFGLEKEQISVPVSLGPGYEAQTQPYSPAAPPPLNLLRQIEADESKRSRSQIS